MFGEVFALMGLALGARRSGDLDAAERHLRTMRDAYLSSAAARRRRKRFRASPRTRRRTSAALPLTEAVRTAAAGSDLGSTVRRTRDIAR
ncbi:hypothetical protein ABZY68_08445 [Streptomyces sp. NPDC006482]|uniref:hypothetical protein n=1 Tax=Streptomyces sp. NPDC006482 TaxID=3154306 RepID=UPI00339ED386